MQRISYEDGIMARVKITRNYQITIPEKIRRRVKLESETVDIEAIDSQRALV
jgi:AbrB family looped-hinge helix DNA binding protein